MDIEPQLIDGAVVLNYIPEGKAGKTHPEASFELVVLLHNWLRSVKLDYLIFDFCEEKFVPPTFIEEIIQLRKRKRCPLLIVGVMEQTRKVLESFNSSDDFPIFFSPEDAVRALRMQYPGITEAHFAQPIPYGTHIFQKILAEVQKESGEIVLADEEASTAEQDFI